jgi:outer membrane protein assembly factor BamB
MRRQALRVALLVVVAGVGLVAAGVPPAAASHAATVTAAPGVRLAPGSGPPTSTVRVSGTGFGAHRAVDIYFDTTHKALASTNGNGKFSGIPVTVPTLAVPGTHYITAVQRHSGRSAQARFLVNTNWNQFRFSSAHSGFNRFENVLSPSNVAGLGLDWSFPTGQQPISSPAVANGVAYIADGGPDLFALNAATGAKVWRAADFNTLSSPAVANGIVYIGDDTGLSAFNAATGTKLWNFSTFRIDASPTVANGVVYAAAGSGMVALNAATGTKLWTFTTGSFGTDTSPAVANGMVYFGSTDHKIFALNAATGTKLWSLTTKGPVFSSPAVANGVVYIGSGITGTVGDQVLALNATTGARVWSFTTGGTESSPAVANGVVYVGSDDGNVYALNAATGTELWSFTPLGAVFSSPAVANGVVYIGAGRSNLYALNAANGTELWNFTAGDVINSSPAVANGVVYVTSLDGNVYAFHLPGGIAGINRPNPRRLHPNYVLSSGRTR